MRTRVFFRRAFLALPVLAVVFFALLWFLNVRDESPLVPDAATVPDAAQIARGAYIARAGDCMYCHTTRGGAPFAGGRGIDTPFGMVYTPNITPDAKTGIGSWTSAEFWRALHNGRAKDGHLLYPVFPYPSYTLVDRADSDALFAYMKSVTPVEQPSKPNALRWPFDMQLSLAVWRALYFTPGVYEADKAKTAEWNRGAYLVRGLGHCASCHGARNPMGATDDSPDLAGGLIPMQNWYAPSLSAQAEAGVAHWTREEVVKLLKTGISPRGSVTGPMAEVVQQSTQYLSDADLGSIAGYLQALQPTAAADKRGTLAPAGGSPAVAPPSVAARGAKLYEQNCAQCHGDRGEGVPGAYPALAGNRAVTLPTPVNLVQIVLNGGFAPATAANPRPFGMPPYVLVLNDADIAAVLTHIRASWGNGADPVPELLVGKLRTNQTQ